MVLQQIVRGRALAPDIGMEVGRDGRTGKLVAILLTVIAQVDGLGLTIDLGRPLPVRAVSKGGDHAVPDHCDGAVFSVVDQGARRFQPRTIRVIGEHVAIGIITHRCATQGRRGMGADTPCPLRRIDQIIRCPTAKAGVE